MCRDCCCCVRLGGATLLTAGSRSTTCAQRPRSSAGSGGAPGSRSVPARSPCFSAVTAVQFLVRLVDPPRHPLPLRSYEVDPRAWPVHSVQERSLLDRHAIDVLVCKASGGAATEAKIIAARELGLPVIMVRRPAPSPAKQSRPSRRRSTGLPAPIASPKQGGCHENSPDRVLMLAALGQLCCRPSRRMRRSTCSAVIGRMWRGQRGQNDAAQVRSLVANDGNPNQTDEEPRTGLHYAAMNGNLTIIAILIKASAKLDAKDKLGNTPLHLAADRNQAEAAQLLLDVGAPVDAENKNGMTPLMVAASRGNIDIVQALLAKHASVTKTDFTGRDAAGWAPKATARQWFRRSNGRKPRSARWEPPFYSFSNTAQVMRYSAASQ